jgi:hypothetical protein
MVNNPLNIRFNKANKWKGQIPIPYMGFVIFKSRVWGARAALRLLNNYITRWGANTIEEIVDRWAPPSENPTSVYIDYVAKRVGLPKNHPLEKFPPNAYKAYLIEILKAMARFEKGKELEMSNEKLEKAYSLI